MTKAPRQTKALLSGHPMGLEISAAWQRAKARLLLGQVSSSWHSYFVSFSCWLYSWSCLSLLASPGLSSVMCSLQFEKRLRRYLIQSMVTLADLAHCKIHPCSHHHCHCARRFHVCTPWMGRKSVLQKRSPLWHWGKNAQSPSKCPCTKQ